MADPFVMWTDVPLGSEFQLMCDGSCSAIDAVALITVNDSPRQNIECEEMCPGPASRDLNEVGNWDIAPTIINMNALPQAVTLTARVTDAAGAVVQVPSGTGGMMAAEASWRSGRSAGSTLNVGILITVVQS